MNKKHKKKPIKIAKLSTLLSCAACSLLGTAHAENEWDVNTAILLYSEQDRVSAFEPVASLKKDLNETDTLNIKITLDSLTGASATGAVPSTQPQTFSRPSGNGSYTIKANETPLDDTFKDGRVQFSLAKDEAIDRQNRRNLGFNFSKEFDFLSVAGNASWTHELNQKNTAITAGVNLEFDQISPIGGIPLALSTHDFNTTIQRQGDNDSRNVIDLLLGVTQIIDKTSLFQVNFSYGQSNGYLTDPFKLVSIVDTTVGVDLGEPTSNIYENRPGSRNKTSLFGKYKKSFSNHNILSTSLRLMTDDWGVNSQTIDVTYRYQLKDGYYLQPHLRFYQQSAADFYRYFLLDSEAIPTYVTADYRLGKLSTQTIGIKFGHAEKLGSNWSARIEQYVQSGNSHPDVAIGQLENQDLFPDVTALIMQVNYSFKW